MHTILVHIANSDPVKLDVEELPRVTDSCVIGRNPRDRSDRELSQIDEGVTVVIYPWHRISYIQVLPSGEESIEFPLLYRD
jgi:hypothetical protein